MDKNELNCHNNNFRFNCLHVWTRKSKVVWRKTFNYGSKSAKIIFFCQIIESVENRSPIMGLQEKVHFLWVWHTPPIVGFEFIFWLCGRCQTRFMAQWWLNDGSTMAHLWLNDGSFMAQLWLRLWLIYGSFMVPFMAHLWLNYGSIMAQLWLIYGSNN